MYQDMTPIQAVNLNGLPSILGSEGANPPSESLMSRLGAGISLDNRAGVANVLQAFNMGKDALDLGKGITTMNVGDILEGAFGLAEEYLEMDRDLTAQENAMLAMADDPEQTQENAMRPGRA